MNPILCYHHLEFTNRDFVVVVADTLELARQAFNKRFPRKPMPADSVVEGSTAICNVEDNRDCALFFTYSTICSSTICHEVTHATNAMFDHIGIRLDDSSDEAYAYHNDMLFRFVAQFLEKHKITIPTYL